MNDLIEQLVAKMGDIPGLEIPPKIYQLMQGEVLDYQENKELTIQFPVKEEYQNPIGHMQGGMILAAVDNTLGPLSYIVAPPSVTVQLNTQYIRPVSPKDKYIKVTAELVDRTRNQLLLRAKVVNELDKLVALCQATQQIISREN